MYWFKTFPSLAREEGSPVWTERHDALMQNYSWILIFEVFEAQDLQWVLPVSTSLSVWFRMKALIGCDKAELCLDKQQTRCQLHFVKQRWRGRSAVSAPSPVSSTHTAGWWAPAPGLELWFATPNRGDCGTQVTRRVATTCAVPQHLIVRLSPALKALWSKLFTTGLMRDN